MSSGHGCGGGEGGGVGGGAEEGSGVNKGPWTAAEDAILMEYVKKHGAWNWSAVQKKSGLSRCGKSCRLRWANHLRPNLKKGALSPDEECLILQLHSELGNKWARMAAQLPGRTDNEIKNYWNTRIKRRRRQGLPLYPPGIQRKTAMHATPRPPAPSRSLLLLDHAAAPVPPPPMGFDAQSFVQDAGYNGGHHQVQYFLPPGAIDRLNAGGFSLPFPSHGQMHPFLHQDFGGAGMANLNLPPDAGVSIKLELPSGQNPDPGSSSLIYEMPATDLDAFVPHSGDGGRAGYLLDPRLGKASLVGHPPPMSLNASSSNAVHWTGSGVGDSNSDHPLPPEISHKEEEGLTTLFNIMPVATIAERVPPLPMGFYAQSFVQDAGYNDGHHQVQYFLPSGAIDRLNAGGFSLPFPSHGQMEPFLHQDFGGAGMANLNLTPDAGVSIKLELPSSQNPDPGSPSLIYEIPATDLDAFVLHSGDGGRAGYLLDPRLGKASLVGHPPPMSLNPSSSNAVHWTGSGGGDSNSDHPLPPGISHKEEEELTTLFNIMPAATTTGVGEWYSDSGEACNSALTEDVDIGLDVQQLASSVPTSAAAETSPDPTGAGDKE